MNGENTTLTSSVTADLLNVHASTVKRWCDDGRILFSRTEGGHRRIRLVHALEAARNEGISTFLDPFHPWEANVWLAVSDLEGPGTYRRLHNLAFSWLSRGETDLLCQLLVAVGLRETIDFPEFLDHGIRGFMSRVGEEWVAGRLAIGEEHMATQVVLEALLRLRPGWETGPAPGLSDIGGHGLGSNEQGVGARAGDRPVAVVGAMEGDHHELGALAVRILLEREGWRVYYLGADVPVEEFAQVQRAQGGDLVCISVSASATFPDLGRAVRVLNEFYRPDHPYDLVFGGDLRNLPTHQVPEGPFRSLAFMGSALELREHVYQIADANTSSATRSAE